MHSKSKLVSRVLARILILLVSGVLLGGLASCGFTISSKGSSGQSSTTTSTQADFSLSVTPSTLALTADSTPATVSILASALNGFSSTTQVAITGLPAGLTASPSSISLAPGVAQTVTLVAASNASLGSAKVVLTATSGTLTHTASLSISVTAPSASPNFSISITPQSLGLTEGGTGQSFQVAAAALNGFTGSVNVVLSGLPAGVTASPSSISLAPGVAQTITLAAAGNASLGSANVVLTATSGTLTHTASLTISVTAPPPAPDFSLSVTPQSLTLTQGGTGQSFQVAAAALNGFTGSINVVLSGLPAGVTATPSSISLTPGVAQTITLAAADNASLGSANVLLTATSGTLTQTASLSVNVAALADFSISITPQSLSLTQGGTGQSFQVTAAAVNGFTASVKVVLSGLPAGVTSTPTTISLTPGVAQTITLAAADNASLGSANVLLTATSGSLTHTATLTLSISQAAISDRIDFGNDASELAHKFQNGDNSSDTRGTGAFSQTYRQPRLIKYGDSPTTAPQQLTFTMAVASDKQNYLTVKLYGSDTQFGELRLVGSDGRLDVLDNNISNGPGNPPFVGRFHYATIPIPISMTQGKTSVTLTLYSSGYYYSDGGGSAGTPTRPVYSGFTHTNPYFIPPAADKTGTAPVQVDDALPSTIDKATVYSWMKHSRAVIYNLDGAPDGFWNPGGTLLHSASVIPAGAKGAPPEVIGMKLYDGAVTQAEIDTINAKPEGAADGWRDSVAAGGLSTQMSAINVLASIYLAPPLTDVNGTVVTGYDKYLDADILQRLVGIYDGLARMQTGGTSGIGGWDVGCLTSTDIYRWSGITSSPRSGGPKAGTTHRYDPGCISFEGEAGVNLGRTMLRMLVDNPTAATAFKAHLNQQIDADFTGTTMKRAYMYERMLAASRNWMGFGLQALTSNNWWDLAGGTAYQEMIFLQYTYSAQLALRQLLALYPNTDADKQPIAPATMRSIIRQILGLDNMVFMQPGDVGWRAITTGGISEDYGTLSSGYDGRYGGGVPVKVGAIATLSKYDTSLSDTDKSEFADRARNTIAGFDNFIYPQHSIATNTDGTITDSYKLGQEDVISYRVPYGPNANGWNLNLQTDAVDPNGVIQSTLALRAFLIASSRGFTSSNTDMTAFLEQEAAWKSIAGVDPATIAELPGEPNAPDFVWADNESGALVLHSQGERLFVNANYRRDKGQNGTYVSNGTVNNYARIHHATDLVDREATVKMPSDAATVLDDGNLSGGVNSPWVVRYGRYLVVMNRSTSACQVSLPTGTGNAFAMHRNSTVPMGSSASVPASDYEVFIMPK